MGDYTLYYVCEMADFDNELPKSASIVGLFTCNDPDKASFYPESRPIEGTDHYMLIDVTLHAYYVCVPTEIKRYHTVPTSYDHIVEQLCTKKYEQIEVKSLATIQRIKAATFDDAAKDFFHEKFYSQMPAKLCESDYGDKWKVHFSSNHKPLTFYSKEDVEVFLSGGYSDAHGMMEYDMAPKHVTHVIRYDVV